MMIQEQFLLQLRLLVTQVSSQESTLGNFMINHSPGQKLEITKSFKKEWKLLSTSKITSTLTLPTQSSLRSSLIMLQLLELHSERNSTMENGKTPPTKNLNSERNEEVVINEIDNTNNNNIE